MYKRVGLKFQLIIGTTPWNQGHWTILNGKNNIEDGDTERLRAKKEANSSQI